MDFNSYTVDRVVRDTIDIATGKVVDTAILHNKSNLKGILETLGFIFDENKNNPYYRKALKLMQEGKSQELAINLIMKQLKEIR
jgi:hypothetical protein